MKKFNVLLAFLFIIFFTFSCDDTKEEVQPRPVEEGSSTNQNVPHYDDKNSTLVTWDQLPEELKNAIPLDTSTSISNAQVNLNNARVNSSYSFRYGPFGGNGGTRFTLFPPSGTRIYAIAIRSTSVVHGLVVWYKKGSTIYRRGVGGTTGKFYQHFFTEGEYIKKIKGRTGWVVDRLTIVTNRKSFTHGGTGGRPFVAEVPSGYQILGFWGKSGLLLDQIGFYAYRR